jgi:hypothetical protein
VGYILEGESDCFYAIDVGQVVDADGNENVIEGMTEPRRISHSFTEESKINYINDSIVIGFKLAHFIMRDEGILKAAFWSETNLYIHPFNPRKSDSEEEDISAIVNNRENPEIEGVSVKRIYGIGVNPN